MRNPNDKERPTSWKFQISKTSVINAKKKLRIKSNKNVPGSKFLKNQKERCERTFKRLSMFSVPCGNERFFDVDDKTYCPVDLSHVPGNEYNNTVSSSDVNLFIGNK